jgi:hypothetical protein
MVDLALLQSVSYIAGALGVCVAAIYYLMNLKISQRNQELSLKALEQSAKAQELSLRTQQQNLETRQAQMFLNIYNQTRSNDYITSFNKIMIEYKWTSFKDWMDLYTNDPEFRRVSDVVGWFYEGLGVLVREGILDIRWIALLICGPTRWYWEKYMPIVEEGRSTLAGNKRWWSESEYLYTELMKYLKEHPELDSRLSNSPYNAQ